MLHLDPALAAADAVPTDPSANAQRRAALGRGERQMAALDRLVEIGMAIAEAAGRDAVGREAAAPGEDGAKDAPRTDPALTYARAARAVRLTIALQTRLAKDLASLARDEVSARRTRIRRVMERVIEAQTEDDYVLDEFNDAVRERLSEAEDLDEFAGRPLAEVVARICADLGLSPDWEGLGEVFAPEDLPPLGEAPGAAGGRGLVGLNAGGGAAQPPSSASRTMTASPTPSALAVKPPERADPRSG